jgi:ABC-type transport system involved in multi-copper enzyme maturation permease subunit
MSSKFWRLFRLNFEGLYRFPSVASIVSLLFFIGSYSVLYSFYLNRGVYLAPGAEWWSSKEAIARVELIILERQALAYFNTFQDSLFALILLIPLLIAFNFAQGFNSGEIRTLLSYPTSRAKVLLTKSCTVICLVSITANVSSVLALAFFFPTLNHISLIMLLLLTQWIFSFLLGSVCTLVAVVSKSAPTTIVTGIGGWVAGFIIASHPESDNVIKGIFHPILQIILYSLGNVATLRGPEVLQIEVITSIAVSVMLGVISLILSLVIFMYREV